MGKCYWYQHSGQIWHCVSSMLLKGMFISKSTPRCTWDIGGHLCHTLGEQALLEGHPRLLKDICGEMQEKIAEWVSTYGWGKDPLILTKIVLSRTWNHGWWVSDSIHLESQKYWHIWDDGSYYFAGGEFSNNFWTWKNTDTAWYNLFSDKLVVIWSLLTVLMCWWAFLPLQEVSPLMVPGLWNEADSFSCACWHSMALTASKSFEVPGQKLQSCAGIAALTVRISTLMCAETPGTMRGTLLAVKARMPQAHENCQLHSRVQAPWEDLLPVKARMPQAHHTVSMIISHTKVCHWTGYIMQYQYQVKSYAELPTAK